MILAVVTSLLLSMCPDEPDELEALEAVVQAALKKAGPYVVRIETVGGIRRVNVPTSAKRKMTVPERPNEDEARPERKPAGNDPDGNPGGRTPRFRNEFEKMLALPGFKKAEGPTTGVILSRDGYILTSAWNFEDKPSVISVTLSNGRTYAAQMLGVDRAASLAMLKIDADDLPVPEFLDPNNVRIGAWALALGRSLTRKNVEVKYGIISAKNRILGIALQTDAATSPSNYGGPLVDVEGRVYGIIVPLGSRGRETNPNWYDSGIGFAVPIRDPAKLIAQLGKTGVILQPAYLGVQMDQDRTKPGAKVTQVLPKTGAAKAGLKKGDIVLSIDGEEVKNAFTLRFEIGRRRAGDKVRLKVQRGGETFDIEAELGARPKPQANRGKLPVRMPGQKPDRNKDQDR